MSGSTFCFDLERRPDQSEQSGVKGDGAVAVQGHVHPNQALRTERKSYEVNEG